MDGWLALHHVVAAKQGAGNGVSALAILKGYGAIDDGVPKPLGLLDDAPLAAREVVGVDGGAILQPQLLQIVDHQVGGVAFLEDASISDARDSSGQSAHLVMGLLQAHDLPVTDPGGKQVHRPGAQGEVTHVGATVRDAGMGVRMV